MGTAIVRSNQSAIAGAVDIRAILGSASRSAVLASPDVLFRTRVRETLVGMRWQVREAAGGAEALAYLNAAPSEALILDSWLPDLEIDEFIVEFKRLHPQMDLVIADETSARHSILRSPRRNELLHALRQGQNVGSSPSTGVRRPAPQIELVQPARHAEGIRLPELIGDHPLMLDVSRRIRLVAPHSTSVLIQGSTGTGKELVAKAIHRLSPRAAKPFVALNCAAIPESLLETELFGHARGAFTGAVQRRTGRIEAAQGGTLLLDEIGEMPLLLQAKLLRFVECGELQRVGDNDTIHVDVRILAATHRPLAQLSREGSFRADLYYRLAVFTIKIPNLSAHGEDIGALVEHFMGRLAQNAPAKRVTAPAMERLRAHNWPGNVRELEHVLERAFILAEDRTEIGTAEIEFADDPLESLVPQP